MSQEDNAKKQNYNSYHTIRIKDDTYRILTALAEYYGVSMASMIAILVREKASELGIIDDKGELVKRRDGQ